MKRWTRTVVVVVEIALVLLIAARWSSAESTATEPEAIARAVASTTVAPSPAAQEAAATVADVTGGAGATGTAAPAPGGRVLLIGDSILRQTGPALSELFGAQVTVDNQAVNGSGLLTPSNVDWVQRFPELLAADEPEAVVFLFIGNYTDSDFWLTDEGQPIAQDTLAFYAAWSRQADHLMEALDGSDAEVYWVLPPPEYTPFNQSVTANLRELYTQLAQRWPKIHLIDANDALAGPNGEYLESVTDESGTVVPLRVTDTVHLTEAGAARLAETIHGAVAQHP